MRIKAQIKQISSKNLVSGDKEVRIILIIHPEDNQQAIELAKLKPEEEIIIEYESRTNKRERD